MAFTSDGTLGATNEKTSDTTITLTLGANAEAGRLVVVLISADNQASADAETSEVSSVSDSAGGNTWTKIGEYCNAQGAADAGCTIAAFFSVLTNQINSGGTITGNLANSKQSKAISAWKWSIGAGNTVQLAGTLQTVADDGPGNASALSLSGLSNIERLYIRALANESSSATDITATASYTRFTADQTTGGGAATNMGIRGEWRILTGTGDTSDPNFASGDQASIFRALEEVASGPVSKSGTDTLTPMTTEASTLLGLLSRTDTLSPMTTEAATLLGLLSRTDSLTPMTTEAATLLGILAVAETLSISLTDVVSALQVTLARSDTVTVTLTELAALLVQQAATETLTITLEEATTISVVVLVAETLTVTLSEALQTILVLLSRADTVSVSAADVISALFVTIGRSDAVAITIADQQALSAVLAAIDTLLVLLSEVGTVAAEQAVTLIELTIEAATRPTLVVNTASFATLTVSAVEGSPWM